jgi:hypothetical protein
MEKVKGGKVYVKPFNYLCGLACIGTGVLCFFGGDKSNIYGWLAPFYFGVFGLMMIASDLNIKVIIESCNFLDKYAGRGLFNIFVGSQILDEASATSANSTDDTSLDNLFAICGNIIAYAIMLLGFYLVVLHCLESDTSINGIQQSLQKQAAKAIIKNQFK